MRRGVCLCTDTMPVCYANFRDGLQKLHEHNLDMNWLEQCNELLSKRSTTWQTGGVTDMHHPLATHR